MITCENVLITKTPVLPKKTGLTGRFCVFCIKTWCKHSIFVEKRSVFVIYLDTNIVSRYHMYSECLLDKCAHNQQVGEL